MHANLSHPGHDTTVATGKKLGCKVIGQKSCDSCQRGKAKQKPVRRFAKHRESRRAAHLCLDLAWFKKPSLGKSRYWLLVVDEATRMSWSLFMKNKDELSNKMIDFLATLEEKGIKLRKMKF